MSRRLPLEDHRRRQQARNEGRVYYTPTQPCVHGHEAPRLVSNNSCTECSRARRQRRFEAEQERLRVLHENGPVRVEFEWHEDGTYTAVPVRERKRSASAERFMRKLERLLDRDPVRTTRR